MGFKALIKRLLLERIQSSVKMGKKKKLMYKRGEKKFIVGCF